MHGNRRDASAPLTQAEKDNFLILMVDACAAAKRSVDVLWLTSLQEILNEKMKVATDDNDFQHSLRSIMASLTSEWSERNTFFVLVVD